MTARGCLNHPYGYGPLQKPRSRTIGFCSYPHSSLPHGSAAKSCGAKPILWVNPLEGYLSKQSADSPVVPSWSALPATGARLHWRAMVHRCPGACKPLALGTSTGKAQPGFSLRPGSSMPLSCNQRVTPQLRGGHSWSVISTYIYPWGHQLVEHMNLESTHTPTKSAPTHTQNSTTR